MLTASIWARIEWYMGRVTATLTRMPVSKTSRELAKMMRFSAFNQFFMQMPVKMGRKLPGCAGRIDVKRKSVLVVHCLDGL